MIGSFSSEVELPHQVEWTTVGSPNTVSRDYLAISSMIPAAGSGAGAGEASSNADAGEAHPTALLSLGAMQCLLCGDRTPVLHVRCGWDPDSDDEQPCDPQLDANSVFNGFVLSAGGDILCFALSRQSTAAQCAAVLTSLQEHASVYELELPLGEWEGVTTAPTAESSQVPDWMVSRMHRGSAALQRAILVSARVVAAGCDRVGAGVSAVMPERRLPQLPWEEAERMQQGLEAVRRTPYVASSEWCRGARLHAPLHPSPRLALSLRPALSLSPSLALSEAHSALDLRRAARSVASPTSTSTPWSRDSTPAAEQSRTVPRSGAAHTALRRPHPPPPRAWRWEGGAAHLLREGTAQRGGSALPPGAAPGTAPGTALASSPLTPPPVHTARTPRAARPLVP